MAMKKIYILLIFFAGTFANAQTNLLNNGTFDNNGLGWSTFIPKSDSKGSVSVTGGNATFTSSDLTGNNWDNFGIYQAVTLNPGTYVMDFDLSFNGLNDTWGDLLLGNIQPENGKDYKVGTTDPNEIAALSWIEEIYNTWDCSNGIRNNPDVIRTGINNDGSVVKASAYIEKASHTGSGCDTSAPSGSINFEITTAGTYYIVFKTGNWEGRFGSTGVIIDNMTLYNAATLGVKNNESEIFTVYPNPANDSWTVTSKGQEIKSIEIFDLLGKKIKSLQPNSTSINIDASNFISGAYIINVGTDLGVVRKKIIKK